MKKGLLALLVLAFTAAGSFVACGDNGTLVGNDSGGTDALDEPDVKTNPVDATQDSTDAPPTDAPPFLWPDCVTMPAGAQVETIDQIWADNPSVAKQLWIPGVYVTAIDKGACVAGVACELIVQQDLTYPSLAAGAQHAIREWVTTKTSKYFTGLAVGDQVNMLAWAYRDTASGANELILHVDTIEPGCAHKIGSGAPTPIPVHLYDIDSIADYEQTYGPLLLSVPNVTGTPKQPNQFFGLGETFWDGGLSDGQIISVSPYYMDGGAFVGLEAGVKRKFASVSGVYNEYYNPDASATKYLNLGARTSSDLQ